jgi:hypothetical protein
MKRGRRRDVHRHIRSCGRPEERIVNINTAVVLAWSMFVAAFATGCGIGSAQAGGDAGDPAHPAHLEIKGGQGGEFSGSCTIGDEKPEKIGGRVPESLTYELRGRPLDCEISSGDDLRVELVVGDDVRSVQNTGGGTLNLTYDDGSVRTSTSSSSTSGKQDRSSSSRVGSSVGASDREPGGKDGSGSLTEESRNVGGFHEVELNGIGKLLIEQTGSESLTVEAEEDVIPNLRTEVVDDRLILGPKPGTTVRTTEPITYRLTLEDLDALEVSGSGGAEAEGIDTDRLAVTVGGSGSVKIGGQADEQEVHVSGNGDYRAGNLVSKEAKINVSGAGSAIVGASEMLDAKVSGAGSVEYVGNPKVEQDISGAGRVSRR